jgi:hypothetical protein
MEGTKGRSHVDRPTHDGNITLRKARVFVKTNRAIGGRCRGRFLFDEIPSLVPTPSEATRDDGPAGRK